MSTHSRKRFQTFFLLANLLLFSLPWTAARSNQARSVSPVNAGKRVYLPIIRHSYPFAFKFISWSDTKKGTDRLAILSNQVVKLQPAFTMYPGDLENDGFTTQGIKAWKNALNGGVSNRMFDITMPQRGNHDQDNTARWQDYFDIAGTAARVGATHFSTLTKDLTYSFDYGNARFIAIDVPGDVTMIKPAEIQYLDQVLADAESRGLGHAFIFFHGPIYPISAHTTCPTRTCPTPNIVASLVRVLNKHKIVSAVFHGHEHVQAYIHLDSSRIPEITHPFEEFITGSAGSPLYGCDKTYRFDYCGSYDGFALISVKDKSFTVSIYQANRAGPVKIYKFTRP